MERGATHPAATTRTIAACACCTKARGRKHCKPTQRPQAKPSATPAAPRTNACEGEWRLKLHGRKAGEKRAETNAQVNRRQCEALTSELNLQLGSTAFAHWGVTCACALNPAPYSMHICLKLRAKVLLKCAFLGLNLKAIHVCNECWEQCQCDQV